MEYTFYRLKSKNIEIKEFYIGSTWDLDMRKRKHKSICNNEGSPGYNFKVYQYIRSNGGWDEFEIEIIDKIVCCEIDRFLHEDKLTDLYGATLNSRRNVLTEEERIAKRKEWRENNPEKVKDYNQEWYENNKEKIKEYHQEWYENNKEKRKEYIENNKEKINQQQRERRLKKKLATSI